MKLTSPKILKKPCRAKTKVKIAIQEKMDWLNENNKLKLSDGGEDSK